jgi:Xaa-Pro aminopeptidase
MKGDLPRLMEERGLDVLIIEGPDGTHGANPAFSYFTKNQHLVGTVIIKRNKNPVLLHRSMERDAAEATGLELINLDRWPIREILEQFPDPLDARVELYRRIFHDLGVRGRVAFYGTGPLGSYYALLRQFDERIPEIEVVGEFDRGVLSVARETKDPDEIEAMRRVGEETCAVIEAAVEFLKSHRLRDETLVKDDGTALTVGDVKSFVRLELARRGLEAPEFIFAVGRDAGVPHSIGVSSDPIVLGKTIVFDLFPRDASGYYHDITRTFCLGYAPVEVERAYRDVLEAFEAVAEKFLVGGITQSYQHFVCKLFEKRGHLTILSDPKTRQGYVHSLGHGLGLEVHEQPHFPTFGKCETALREGMVFTVEPGLYYPEQDFGIRVEDTYYCDEDGEFRSLTPLPRDLVLPIP